MTSALLHIALVKEFTLVTKSITNCLFIMWCVAKCIVSNDNFITIQWISQRACVDPFHTLEVELESDGFHYQGYTPLQDSDLLGSWNIQYFTNDMHDCQLQFFSQTSVTFPGQVTDVWGYFASKPLLVCIMQNQFHAVMLMVSWLTECVCILFMYEEY